MVNLTVLLSHKGSISLFPEKIEDSIDISINQDLFTQYICINQAFYINLAKQKIIFYNFGVNY